MENAKIYKTFDPESANPNALDLFPTQALIDELVSRLDMAVISYMDCGNRIANWHNTDRRGYMALDSLTAWTNSQVRSRI